MITTEIFDIIIPIIIINLLSYVTITGVYDFIKYQITSYIKSNDTPSNSISIIEYCDNRYINQTSVCKIIQHILDDNEIIYTSEDINNIIQHVLSLEELESMQPDKTELVEFLDFERPKTPQNSTNTSPR